MKRILVGISVVILLSQSALAGIEPHVIYGDDNRLDLYQVTSTKLLNLARSTAAIFDRADLKQQASYFEILTGNFAEEMRVCRQEPFAEQQAGAVCSAFLISDNLVATAGHCVKVNDCEKVAFVFDHSMLSANQDVKTINNENIFFCDRIMKREQTSVVDYAIIRLDRSVPGREPLSFAQSYPSVGTPTTVIGHPGGLPTKVADGGVIRRTQTGYFVTDLDAYGGNSGSPVLNSQTLEVMGILVRGEKDYVFDPENDCSLSKRCGQADCEGEEVTHISYVQEALRP